MDPIDAKHGASNEAPRETLKQSPRDDTVAADTLSEKEDQGYGHMDVDQDGLNTEAEVTGIL